MDPKPPLNRIHPLFLVILTGSFTLIGCQTESLLPSHSRSPAHLEETQKSIESQPNAAAKYSDPYRQFRSRASGRIVAIGDIHGDLLAAQLALRLAGAIDSNNHWIGGNLVVVQTGDQIDRWNEDREVLDLFSNVATEAEEAGGRVISLNGNHELMNVSNQFWVVKPESFNEFLDIQVPPDWHPPSYFPKYMPNPIHIPKMDKSQVVKPTDPGVYQRAYAFSPGGHYAKILANRPFFAIVNDTVFVHGGISPKALSSGLLQSMERTKDWMLGNIHIDSRLQITVETPVQNILNNRTYSRLTSDGVEKGTDPEHQETCKALAEVLAALGVKRMVVGHQIQPKGISKACNGQVWRIDIGFSQGYGSSDHVEALEITNDDVKILRGEPEIPLDSRDTIALLVRASFDNNMILVQRLVKKAANLDRADSLGTTPLYMAAQMGHLDIARLLIEKGAKVNVPGHTRPTPLGIAAFQGHSEIVKLLVNEKADLETQMGEGFTPLANAVYMQREDAIRILLEAGANPFAKTKKGYSMRFLAAHPQNGHASAKIKSLLQRWEKKWTWERNYP